MWEEENISSAIAARGQGCNETGLEEERTPANKGTQGFDYQQQQQQQQHARTAAASVTATESQSLH
jgi:hypothetical protein